MDIIIPWRDCGDPQRKRLLDATVEHYELAGFNIVYGDANIHPFNRSAARNEGAKQSSDDVLVFVDADAIIEPRQIIEARARAIVTQRMVKPFSFGGYATKESTEAWLLHRGIDLDTIHGLQENFIGLSWVLTRDAFQKVGGFDEQFIGYGGEDNAFQMGCKLVLGDVLYVPGVAYSLWHDESVRNASEKTWKRTRAYWNLKTVEDYWRLRNAT